MPNFTEALSKKATEIEKPKPKPAGFYLSMIQGLPKVKKVTAQGEEKEIMSFVARPLMANKVDDQEALAALPEVNTWPPQNIDFWEGEQGEYALKMFLTNTLEIDPGPPNKSKTLGEMCAEAAGKQLLTEYENYPYTDKAGQLQIGTRIKSTAKA